jgi:hypothetical protein
MDNITDEQINKMVNLLVDKLVKKIYGTREQESDMMWYADDEGDHMIGELARLMTLLNLYEEREEYEKCHLINKHITRVTRIVENL